MREDSMVDNFDILDFEILAGDAVTNDAWQGMGFTKVKGTKEWDKFDNALVKKKSQSQCNYEGPKLS